MTENIGKDIDNTNKAKFKKNKSGGNIIYKIKNNLKNDIKDTVKRI